METYSIVPRTKLFKGRYTELTIFWYKLQLRFSRPQTAAWWGNKSLYDFGAGHGKYTEKQTGADQLRSV